MNDPLLSPQEALAEFDPVLCALYGDHPCQSAQEVADAMISADQSWRQFARAHDEAGSASWVHIG
ncbi:hypothetical protein HNQ59_001992 [Chitinivorax tropicus]|uniref:Uncharacterized protein n=1 Tax=Chitinivorax tropicus TaxID=714531 RepID=A0A840MU49_9PROT|nr:hypothetical protein [Chitinivorax tropicus]MBB5018701.1 hypothetical protein [Chitinivorax tropicus]